MVKTPAFHVVDRGSIRRQGKLFQVYKGFYEIKGTSSDVKKSQTGKNLAVDYTEKQLEMKNSPTSLLVNNPIFHNGDRGSISRQRQLFQI